MKGQSSDKSTFRSSLCYIIIFTYELFNRISSFWNSSRPSFRFVSLVFVQLLTSLQPPSGVHLKLIRVKWVYWNVFLIKVLQNNSTHGNLNQTSDFWDILLGTKEKWHFQTFINLISPKLILYSTWLQKETNKSWKNEWFGL